MFFNTALRHCPFWLKKQLSGAYFTVRNISRKGSGKMDSNLKTHTVKTIVEFQSMSVHILPALQDNFMYLIVDDKTKEAAVVDPVTPGLVASTVEEHKVNLTTILTTHHHWDHAGGNTNMLEKFKDVLIYGGDDRIDGIHKIVGHGDSLEIGSLKVKCLATPCHTTGHICYVVNAQDDEPPSVFTGDTLFVGGCGRFFEGTPEQMCKALLEVLGSLPEKTNIFCGHEYTCANLQFGMEVEPLNQDIKEKFEWAKNRRKLKAPTVPSTIEDEKKTNPFMRVNEPSVKEYTAMIDPIATMGSLRKEKDSFKPKEKI
ncbi:hydroxyacylglutathione hydrolase, mitochondrial isoform X2 [Fopius arisanus]|uniref:hydroxyacylglutathione hydrolase n=1 Tax=Fopius arisanus TaxID=64838 RepID=A0A9R1T285_9HYME|nr:PREDICTED: hydroxyacylglutathione hydrolase, mitochondrial isoform X2 [Fopius arisanus]